MKTLTWIALSTFVITGIIGCACPPPNPPVQKVEKAPMKIIFMTDFIYKLCMTRTNLHNKLTGISLI